MKFIDLSTAIEDNPNDPWWVRDRIKYQQHKFGALSIMLWLGLPVKYLKNQLGWAFETLKVSTHSGTHVDAPWHYTPISEGKRAKTIDEIPLDRFFGNGVVINVTHRKHGELITQKDIEDALNAIPHILQPDDIVLIHTGNDKRHGTREYYTKGPGMSREATLYLIKNGVRVMGIDSWGFDLPLQYAAKQAKKKKDHNFFWQAHYVGVDHDYSHIERLTNLDKLPLKGFKVACFPIKIKGASAGFSRVVAMIED